MKPVFSSNPFSGWEAYIPSHHFACQQEMAGCPSFFLMANGAWRKRGTCRGMHMRFFEDRRIAEHGATRRSPHCAKTALGPRCPTHRRTPPERARPSVGKHAVTRPRAKARRTHHTKRMEGCPRTGGRSERTWGGTAVGDFATQIWIGILLRLCVPAGRSDSWRLKRHFAMRHIEARRKPRVIPLIRCLASPSPATPTSKGWGSGNTLIVLAAAEIVAKDVGSLATGAEEPTCERRAR